MGFRNEEAVDDGRAFTTFLGCRCAFFQARGKVLDTLGEGGVLKSSIFAQTFGAGAECGDDARRRRFCFKTIDGAGQRFAEAQTISVAGFQRQAVKRENRSSAY